MGNSLSLAVSIGVPLVGGLIGGLVTQKDVLTWYPTLKKPRWTPPNFLFGPVWTALYVMMGTASWLVWRKKGGNRVALGLYGAQLGLNLIWNPLFFKTHKTDVALVDITALLGLATAATVAMSRTTSPAVQLPLMVPYLVWLSYATALNANIWLNNPSERLIKPRGKGPHGAEGMRVIKKEEGAARRSGGGSAVLEAAQAAVTGMEAVKAASEAVSAGSAAVHHAAAAAKPVVAAAEKVKHSAESLRHVVQEAGVALGVAAPQAAPPPYESAGVTPGTMAPVSQAMTEEVHRAAAAAAAATKTTRSGAAATSGVGSTLGATAVIEEELKKAGAI